MTLHEELHQYLTACQERLKQAARNFPFLFPIDERDRQCLQEYWEKRFWRGKALALANALRQYENSPDL